MYTELNAMRLAPVHAAPALMDVMTLERNPTRLFFARVSRAAHEAAKTPAPTIAFAQTLNLGDCDLSRPPRIALTVEQVARLRPIEQQYFEWWPGAEL